MAFKIASAGVTHVSESSCAEKSLSYVCSACSDWNDQPWVLRFSSGTNIASGWRTSSSCHSNVSQGSSRSFLRFRISSRRRVDNPPKSSLPSPRRAVTVTSLTLLAFFAFLGGGGGGGGSSGSGGGPSSSSSSAFGRPGREDFERMSRCDRFGLNWCVSLIGCRCNLPVGSMRHGARFGRFGDYFTVTNDTKNISPSMRHTFTKKSCLI